MVQLGVATLEGKIVEEEVQEDRIAVEVREEELILCDGRICEWEERTEGKR